MNRRALFGGAAVLAVTPSIGSAAAPAALDAALAALVDQHIRNRDAVNAYDGPLDVTDCPLWQAYSATLDAIDEAEPQTMAGILAKARAAVAEDEQTGEQWGLDIAHDLLRLAGIS